jgi:prepilin-type N-terminal cleavage/methylation domain-containing protein
MFNYKNKKGFTLVEILVVMGIIAMLSTLAVNGYLSYRRSALLDLGADNLVSEINAMKAKATYGSGTDSKYLEIKKALEAKVVDKKEKTIVVANPAQCYGVVFEGKAGAFTVSSFSVNFVNTKVWRNNIWQYQGCDKLDSSKGKQKLSSDAQMQIVKIDGELKKGGAYSPVGPLILRFLPPDGKLEFVDMGNPQTVELKTLKIKVSYGDTEDLNYQREIVLDLLSEKFSVNKIETQNAQ